MKDPLTNLPMHFAVLTTVTALCSIAVPHPFDLHRTLLPPFVQLKRRPTTTYMESVQTDINPMMRSILLDWLVEVGMEYRLTSDTLFLSAAYIDRFLSLVDVRRNRLQLVGVTAMLVASKYEEIYAPQVEEFCYITDNTYTREQVGCVGVHWWWWWCVCGPGAGGTEGTVAGTGAASEAALVPRRARAACLASAACLLRRFAAAQLKTSGSSRLLLTCA